MKTVFSAPRSSRPVELKRTTDGERQFGSEKRTVASGGMQPSYVKFGWHSIPDQIFVHGELLSLSGSHAKVAGIEKILAHVGGKLVMVISRRCAHQII